MSDLVTSCRPVDLTRTEVVWVDDCGGLHWTPEETSYEETSKVRTTTTSVDWVTVCGRGPQ